jgi:hypothetical protein
MDNRDNDHRDGRGAKTITATASGITADGGDRRGNDDNH